MSLQGAYLSLTSRPRLQSELRVAIEAAGDQKSSQLSLRATVVHCEAGREKTQHGVGVMFVEDEEHERPRD
jgi:hypothetical protein